MNYYRNYRCELVFDSVTGMLRIESDVEAHPFVERFLNRKNLMDTHFTRHAKVKAVDFRSHCGNPNTPSYSSQEQFLTSEIGIKQDPYLMESLSDSDICSEISSEASLYNNSVSSPIPSQFAQLLPAFEEQIPEPQKAIVVTTTTKEINDSDNHHFFEIRALLDELQQLPCKALVKQLIRVAIPSKKIRFPYKYGEKSRPNFWPSNVPHRQPDHMSKTHRITLIHYLLTKMDPPQVVAILYQFRGNLDHNKRWIIDNILLVLGGDPIASLEDREYRTPTLTCGR